MTDNNEAKRPVLSLKRKSSPKPDEVLQTPQKPVHENIWLPILG